MVKRSISSVVRRFVTALTAVTLIATSLVLAQPATTPASADQSTGANSEIDYALTLTGVGGDGSFLKVDNHSDFNRGSNASLMVEAWVRPTSVGAQNVIFAKDRSYVIRASSNGWLLFTGDGTNWGSETIGGSVELNVWQHVALVLEQAQQRLYINGHLVATVNNTHGDGNSVFSVGAYFDGNAPFAGDIDEVKLWVNKNQSDIPVTMNTRASASDANLRAYWDFNEDSGATVYNRKSDSTQNLVLQGTGTRNDVKQVVSIAPNDRVITFPRTYLPGNGVWTVPEGVETAQVLVVAGGGAGGGGIGGGGGAGEVLFASNYAISGSYNIVVGNGGIPTFGSGGRGANSAFGSLEAFGGGGGGKDSGSQTVAAQPANGNSFGSGAGAGFDHTAGTTNSRTLAGVSRNANAGGDGSLGGSAEAAAGGGGGAKDPGGTAIRSSTLIVNGNQTTDSGFGGNGGAGIPYSITGSDVTYGCGGGGGVNGQFNFSTGSPGGGGCGSAGDAGLRDTTNDGIPSQTNGFAADANSGSGGGGASNAGQGGAGGSGIVVVRYTLPSSPTPTFGAVTSATGGFTVPVTNYLTNSNDSTYTWDVSSTVGTVSLDSQGLITVTGLGSEVTATVTISVSRTGYSTSSGTASGTSLPVYPACAPTASSSIPGYTVLTFASTGICNWEVPSGVTEVDLLVIGGGGGAGTPEGRDIRGGSGGAGGVFKATEVDIPANVLVRVGAAGGAQQFGSDSAFGSLLVGGGGFGPEPYSSTHPGNGRGGSNYVSGGSGGGGNHNVGAYLTKTQAGTGGSIGTVSFNGASYTGVAGAAGTNGGSDWSQPGTGGQIALSDRTSDITGTSVVYASGGTNLATAAPQGYGSGGHSRFGWTSGVQGVVIVKYANSACTPTEGTYVGNGTNGTLNTNYRTYTFSPGSSCPWTVPVGITEFEALLVGGGGGGGAAFDSGGAGGGAGGQVVLTDIDLNGLSSVIVQVGSGGAGGVGSAGTPRETNGSAGGNSTIFNSGASLASALGGDGGARSRGDYLEPARSLGAGGAAATANAPARGGAMGGNSQSATWGMGGGGGGSFGAGSNGQSNTAAAAQGGAGTPVQISGSLQTYGRGGNGSAYWATPGNGVSAVSATGNGGGGARASSNFSDQQNGGSGGAGIIILRTEVAPASYTVNFDANTGTGTMASRTEANNVAFTLPANSFEKSGFTFQGWNTKADGSGTSYAAGDSVTLTGTSTVVTFYPKWRAALSITTPSTGLSATFGQSYNLSLAAAGGSGGYVYSVTSGTLPAGLALDASSGAIAGTPTAAGSATIQVTAEDSESTSVTTLSFTIVVAAAAVSAVGTPTATAPAGVAKQIDVGWAAVPNADFYTVKVYNQAGTNLLATISSIVGVSTSITTSNYASIADDTNYSITVTAIASGNYAPGPESSHVSVKTNYSRIVTFNFNQATSGATPTTLTYVEGDTLPTLPTPARTGYTLDGWYREANFATLVGAAGASFTPHATYTAFAQWEANDLTVTWNSNGGSAVDSTTVKTDAQLASPANPNRTGQTFAGWSATDGGSAVSFPYTHSQTANFTMYALWTINSYNLTLDNEGTTTTQTVVFGTNPTNPGTTRTGFTLAGWSDEADQTAEYLANLSDYTMGAANDTLFAVWVTDLVTVTFKSNYTGGPSDETQSVQVDTETNLTANSFTRTGYTFAGWHTNSQGTGGTNYTNSQAVTISSALELFAKWTANTYTVTFSYDGADGGTRPVTLDYTVDGDGISLPTPTKTGYTFLGWFEQSDLSGTALSGPYQPDSTRTIYAKWSINSYTLTLDNEGTTTTQSVVFDAPPTDPGTTRTGYTLDGWSTTQGGSKEYESDLSDYEMGAANDIVYAVWIANTYVVTFEYNLADGGNELVSANYTTDGVAVTLPTPTRTGFDFGGWYLASNFSGSALGATFTTTADVTIYAKWSGATFTVTFDYNGATGGADDASDNFTTGLTAITLPTPTKTGYNFGGWYEASNFAGSALGATYTTTSDITIYAKWNPATFTITYNYNGATAGNSVATASFTTDGVVVTLPNPTRTGYEFEGWYEASNFAGSQLGLTYTTTQDRTLYAKWSTVTYTVLFEYNGADGGESTASVTYTTEAAGFTLPVPTKTGHTFAGWFEAVNLTGSAVTSPYTTTTNRTLYAKWNAIEYTVTYNPNQTGPIEPTGGNVPTVNTTYTIGQAVPILANSLGLYRNGYTFAGWVVNADGTGTALNAGDSLTMGSANINLYPKWSANTYTISYNLNGGSGDLTGAPTSWTVGTSNVSLPTTGFTKTGFNFDGWSATQGGSKLATSYNTLANVTLYARWTIKSISYNFDKGTAAGLTITGWPSDAAANFGSSITLPDLDGTNVTISGGTYTFFGWQHGGSTYQSGASFVLGESSPTFTAQWVQLFDVTYGFGGGTHAVAGDGATECATNGIAGLCVDQQPINLRSAPTRDGHDFLGWRVQATNTTKAASASHVVTATGYLFFAQWNPINYVFSFNSLGGSNNWDSETKNIGQLLTMPNPGVRSGYTFAGWTPDSGSTLYTIGSSYLVATEGVAFEASWTPNVYTVVYDWQGAIGTPTPDVSYTVGTGNLNLPLLGDRVKDGYTFAGWSTSSSGSVLESFQPTSNDVLYAIWIDGNYTLSYDARGGNAGGGMGSVGRGNSVTLPTPTRAGFVFQGWFDHPTAGSKVGDGGQSVTPSRSLTMHARWVQRSLFGVDLADLDTAATLTVGAGASGGAITKNSIGTPTASVVIPNGSLPENTVVSARYFKDLQRQANLIPGDNNYIFSLLVSWLTGTGTSATVPDTDPNIPIVVTLNSGAIKVGQSIYQVIGDEVTFLGRATQDGQVVVELFEDPEIVVASTKPEAPTALTGTAGDQQVALSWSAPSTNGGSEITSYTVTAAPGGASCVTSSTGCTIAGLTNGTSYTFTVTATNSVGTSTASQATSSISPALASYTVTFDSNGGSAVSSGNFVAGGSIAQPANPTRPGFTFNGWSSTLDNVSTKVTFPYSPVASQNLTLYALWTPVEVSSSSDNSLLPSPTPNPGPRPGNAAPPSQIGFIPTPPTTPVSKSGPVGTVVGSSQVVRITADAEQKNVVATGLGWQIQVRTEESSGEVSRVSQNLTLNANVTGTAVVTASGLRPNTVIEVWAFSDQTYIGTLRVNASGQIEEEFTLPKTLLPGEHTLQLGTLNAFGQLIKVSIPLKVKGKVTVGTFKGFIAIYTLDLLGQKLSAKVAGKWIVQEPLVAYKKFGYSRIVRFTGAGYDIVVETYINGEFFKRTNTRTR